VIIVGAAFRRAHADLKVAATLSSQILDTTLAVVSVLPLNRGAARAAASARADLEKRGLPIGPLDNLIAGTALAYHATLVTRNIREFSRLRDLSIVDWYD